MRLRPLAGGGEEDLGRRGVGIFLEEVVLDLPGVVVAEPIGQLELVEGVVVEPPLAVRAPRPRQLHLVEDPEFHRLVLWGGPLLFGVLLGSRAAAASSLCFGVGV